MVTAQVTAIGEYMTVREAAKYKRCSEAALYQAIRLKNLPHVRMGRTILVRPSDIVSYIPRS